METKGKLHKKFDTKKVSDKFKSREFVLITDDKYPQYVTFQATQDKCSLLDDINEGAEVTVSFNLRGKEWQNPNTLETKYFNTLDVFKIGFDNSNF